MPEKIPYNNLRIAIRGVEDSVFLKPQPGGRSQMTKPSRKLKRPGSGGNQDPREVESASHRSKPGLLRRHSRNTEDHENAPRGGAGKHHIVKGAL